MYATLWYAGSVIVSLGSPDMTLLQCKELTSIILSDIKESHELEDNSYSHMITGWQTTCEPYNLMESRNV